MGVYNMVFEDEHKTSESETETGSSRVIHVNSNGRAPAISETYTYMGNFDC